MQRLLYHAPDNPNQESPFDRAIVQAVQGQNVSIVSPYIGLQYLHRLIGLSASWRLISDVLEWLSATPVRERGAVFEFLKIHDGLVHHYPAIHAKAVVSRVGAYTGSANLTDAGVLRRTEFGVLLTDPCQVSEVQQWFDDIWGQTSPPPLQSVQELIAELNQISHVAADFADLKATQLESGARRVRAKLVKILGHEPVAISARGAQSLSSGSLAPAPATSAADKTAVTFVQTPSTEPSKKTQLINPPPSSSIATPTPLQPSSFDLDAEIEAYVGRNAVQGFTFEQLHETMRSKSPALTRRETYFAILESCASHPRALFSADAVNRLVYQDGRFVQSSKELLSAALKPLDDMVAAIIDGLSFDETTSMSVTTGKQEMVLAGMKQAGFVVEVGDGLQLAHDALWSPRLKLLERAHIRWANRLAQRSFKRAPGPMLEGASLGLSHLAETSVQAPVVEPAVESMAEGTDSQEVVNESRDHKKDIVFSHLANMRHSKGEKIDIQMPYLITTLVIKSGLSSDDVSRLLNGTYPMYRSPFLAVVTSNILTVDIVADLDGNPHLQNLPLTRREIENSPSLRGLQSPARPPALTTASAPKAVRVRLRTINDADEDYLQIVRWIFTAKPTAKPSTDNQLLRTLEASGVYRDNLRRLFFDRTNRFPKLFSHLHKSKLIKLVQSSLVHYPNTHSFLQRVVWQSGTVHPWLENTEQRRAELTEEVKASVQGELRQSHSKRDTAYRKLFAFISNRIPARERFKTTDELVMKLTQSKLDRFAIEYLLGIDGTPPGQLMRVKEGKSWFYIETDEQALASYKKCRTFVEDVIKRGAHLLHPWLKARSEQQGQARAPSMSGAALALFAPLQWEDRQHLELDTLYVELAKLFNERPPADLGLHNRQKQFREAAIAQYLKVCELRKSAGNKHEPVLSLEIHDGEQPTVEVVIYRGYRAYIHQYPKLQRYLANSAMKLRQV